MFLNMTFSEIEALFRSFIERNNILARIEEIEKWRRDQAVPSIKTNVTNIQNINANITENLLPKIEESVKTATDSSNTALSASDNALSASNIAVEAKNIAEGFLKRIEDAETNAVNASENALNAFDSVQDFANRLMETGKQLGTDLDELMVAEARLRTLLTQELDGIRRQYNEFADSMKIAGESVKKEGEDVKNELQEIVNELARPIRDINTYIKRLQEDAAFYIPFNAAMITALTVSSSAVLFTQTFLGPPENPVLYNYYAQPGNGTIIEEVIEGFGEVGKEFLDISTSLGNFSSTLEGESRKLGERLILANNLINAEFKRFIDTFQRIFFNLSFNLRGETPPGV